MTEPDAPETVRDALWHELYAADLLRITEPPNAEHLTTDQAIALVTRAQAHAQLATSLRLAQLVNQGRPIDAGLL